MKFRTAALSAVIVIAAAVAIPGEAFASTPGCTNGVYTGYCGTQTNHASLPLSWNVRGNVAAVNAQIIGWPNSDFNRGLDFFQFSYAGGTPKIFEYAPNGIASNLCVSQPLPNAGLVLRVCNGSPWQRFVAKAAPSGFTWTNVATGRVVTSGGRGVQLRGVPAPATPGPNQEWDFAG